MTNGIEKSSRRGRTASGLFLALALSYPQVSFATSSKQTTFPSAEAASRALFLAVQHDDKQALTSIVGAGDELLNSNDAVQDRLDRQQFIEKYQEMHRLARGPNEDTILYIGAENWPFPIPLVSTDGVWRFDPDAGQEEVMARQIGENEVTAIDTCRELIRAKDQPATQDKADSNIDTLLAKLETNKDVVPFEAYNFRLLTETKPGETNVTNADEGTPGAFALIAYPAAYRESGVMTFIVDQDGKVYQKDLGPDTANHAAAMTEYHLDSTWTPVPSEP